MKKLFSSLLAVSIGLVAIAPPISQPIQAQTQNPQKQELEKLQKQALQQTEQGKATEAIATLEQVLALARQLKSQEGEAFTLLLVGGLQIRFPPELGG